MPVGTPSAGPLRFVGRTLRHLATPGAGIPDAAPPDSPLTPAAGIGQGGSMSAPYGAPAEPLVANVVARHARPLEGGPHDFAPLVAQAAGVRWILLGEASHGTHDFHRVRAELTKRLVTACGAVAVAVEGDWPDAIRVNRYARGGDGDPGAEEALRGFTRFPQWMRLGPQLASRQRGRHRPRPARRAPSRPARARGARRRGTAGGLLDLRRADALRRALAGTGRAAGDLAVRAVGGARRRCPLPQCVPARRKRAGRPMRR